ncbi:hypothetical protein J6590_028214 [Homalodisca vitripennis]|nr:hypothetical protein J6590_028214 [Homalodisca vitripennis]
MEIFNPAFISPKQDQWYFKKLEDREKGHGPEAGGDTTVNELKLADTQRTMELQEAVGSGEKGRNVLWYGEQFYHVALKDIYRDLKLVET